MIGRFAMFRGRRNGLRSNHGNAYSNNNILIRYERTKRPTDDGVICTTLWRRSITRSWMPCVCDLGHEEGTHWGDVVVASVQTIYSHKVVIETCGRMAAGMRKSERSDCWISTIASAGAVVELWLGRPTGSGYGEA